MSPLPYSVVVATYARPDDIQLLLESLETQTHRPSLVIAVDSSPDNRTAEVMKQWEGRLPVRYERARKPSAAVQRNQGGAFVTTPLVLFVDDDSILPTGTAETICSVFAEDTMEKIGGIVARIEGMQHRAPSALLRRYYRLQAGYDHPTYGGKLFGPAINCLPTFEEEGVGPLIPADWLNAGCVFYRTPLFQREQFPEFEGYSFLEDVHLSSRIGRTHQLFFHRDARFIHNDTPSTFKRNAPALARMRIRHQRIVARDIQGLREPVLTWKLLLHRLFVTFCLLRQRAPSWRGELLGTWT
jgi:GT2 family glycosyltransferase